MCVDRDPAAEERFDELAAEVPCETRFLRMDYVDALKLLENEGFSADLVYFDLGISSMQVDTRERGFSYSYDAPLDMRMDPTTGLAAKDIVNTYEERRLAKIFATYGEEPNARAIAREIVRRREREPFETTGQLVEAIEAALPAAVRRKFGGGSPAKRVFQADPDRGERRARRPRRGAARGVAAAARGRPPGRDLVPLARGPAGEALPGRPRAWMHLPARPARLRLRPHAGGGAAHARAPWRRRPGEVAQNPRSASGRLRAARRIAVGEAA